MVHLVGGRRGIVAAQYLWNAAQGPEGCLQYLPQGQEGLTGGDLSVASSPIAQHAFEQRVAMGPQCRSRRWRFMGARQSAAQWRNHVQLSSGRTTSQTRRNAGIWSTFVSFGQLIGLRIMTLMAAQIYPR